MAGPAFKQWQEQAEAVRREAYAEGVAEGYAKAMRELKEFLAQKSAAKRGGETDVGAPAKDETDKRKRRGENRALVEGVFRANPSEAASPTEVQLYLKATRNVDIAYSSVRHAFDQLAERGIIERAGDTQWRLAGSKPAPQPAAPEHASLPFRSIG